MGLKIEERIFDLTTPQCGRNNKGHARQDLLYEGKTATCWLDMCQAWTLVGVHDPPACRSLPQLKTGQKY